MDQLEIGKDAFQIHPLMNAMESSSQYPELLRNWKTFAFNLDLPDMRIRYFDEKLNDGTFQADEILRHILREWQSYFRTKATLKVLVECLVDIGLDDIAQKIRERFLNDETSNKASPRPPIISPNVSLVLDNVRDVVHVMSESSSLSLLRSNWTSFMLNLGLREVHMANIKRIASNPELPPSDILGDVLKTWMASFGNQATLDKLCDALVQCRLIDMAESLQERFLETKRGRKEEIIIGQEGCKLSDVAKEMINSNSSSILQKHWKSLAHKLEISDFAIASMQKNEFSSPADIIYDILSQWKAINGSKATLNVLCDALKEICFGAMAELLEQKFSSAKTKEGK